MGNNTASSMKQPTRVEKLHPKSLYPLPRPTHPTPSHFLTSSRLRAFLRKKALHDSQVMTSKLWAKALSPQMRQILSSRERFLRRDTPEQGVTWSAVDLSFVGSGLGLSGPVSSLGCTGSSIAALASSALLLSLSVKGSSLVGF